MTWWKDVAAHVARDLVGVSVAYVATDLARVKRAAVNLAIATGFPLGAAVVCAKRHRGAAGPMLLELQGHPEVRAWLERWEKGGAELRPHPRRRIRR